MIIGAAAYELSAIGTGTSMAYSDARTWSGWVFGFVIAATQAAATLLWVSSVQHNANTVEGQPERATVLPMIMSVTAGIASAAVVWILHETIGTAPGLTVLFSVGAPACSIMAGVLNGYFVAAETAQAAWLIIEAKRKATEKTEKASARQQRLESRRLARQRKHELAMAQLTAASDTGGDTTGKQADVHRRATVHQFRQWRTDMATEDENGTESVLSPNQVAEVVTSQGYSAPPGTTARRWAQETGWGV